MGFPKISTMLMGLCVVGFIAVIFGMLWTNIAAEYSVTADNATINNLTQSYSILENMTDEINDSIKDIESVQEPTSGLSKLEGLATNLWTSMRFIYNSIPFMQSMIGATVDALGLGASGKYLKMMLIVVAFIAIIFVLIYLIFKVQA